MQFMIDLLLVSGIDGLFKITTCINNKSYIWIIFLNLKIGYHTLYKNEFLYTKNTIQSNWTHIEPIINEIQISKCHTQFIIQV
jgi:hypothetical protein